MLYGKEYYASLERAAVSSAGVVVPLVMELLGPRSVLDVGCGDGTWLDAYRRAGVADYFGVDGGDAAGVLKVPADRFAAHDLARPLDLGRRFDLVQALEVAEHLPPQAAEGFVRSLARHGDAVLFSAAIPHQGGVGHLHERWPDYWAGLFQHAGYRVIDCVRPRVWADGRVAWWYAQNCLLFVKEGVAACRAGPLPAPAAVGPGLRLVHPGKYLGLAAGAAGKAPPAPPGPSAGQLLRAGSPSERVGRKPFDVAVVIPTVGRPSLRRAVESVYAQRFPGSVQILIGVDNRHGPAGLLEEVARSSPAHCAVAVFDPGYSTAARHGGFHPAGTGGALRTVLSYAAHSRLVAYLDDDNWWGPDHLATLAAAVAGHDWAYSLRWYADGDAGRPLCVDRWESVGPDAGVFRERFGGFVDPSCLLLDKVACEPVLRLWCSALPGDATGMSSDRPVFDWLQRHGRGAGTSRATAYYALGPADGMHPQRLRWIEESRARGAA